MHQRLVARAEKFDNSDRKRLKTDGAPPYEHKQMWKE